MTKIKKTIKLTYSKEDALKLLSDSIDWPLHSVWFGEKKLKGKIKSNEFTVWPKTKFVRGWPMAIAKGEINETNDTTTVSYSTSAAFPFKHFDFKPSTITISVLVALSAWMGTIFLLIYNKESIALLVLPIAMASICTVFCTFIYFFVSEPEIKRTMRLLDSIFMK